MSANSQAAIRCSALWPSCLALVLMGFASSAWARKTNQAVYEEPFDLAGGGATLTRASKEGVMFANPALMPWGKKRHRWFGSQTAVIINREARQLLKGGDAAAGVDQALGGAVHGGALHATSWITNNLGIAAFGRAELDAETQEFGEAGLPELQVGAETYGGGVLSSGAALSSWFSLGATAKMLRVSEPELAIALTDETAIKSLQSDPSTLRSALSLQSGTGLDLGALFFWQTTVCDLRAAVKIDDIGSTRFTGTQAPFRQTLHAGLGITFHGTMQALHLSVDYRDIQGAYAEKTFKKVYAGAKLLLWNHIGLATGIYQGIPSAGIRLDAVAINLGLTAYGRELGSYVGDKQRNLYVAYVGFGI